MLATNMRKLCVYVSNIYTMPLQRRPLIASQSQWQQQTAMSAASNQGQQQTAMTAATMTAGAAAPHISPWYLRSSANVAVSTKAWFSSCVVKVEL